MPSCQKNQFLRPFACFSLQKFSPVDHERSDLAADHLVLQKKETERAPEDHITHAQFIQPHRLKKKVQDQLEIIDLMVGRTRLILCVRQIRANQHDFSGGSPLGRVQDQHGFDQPVINIAAFKILENDNGFIPYGLLDAGIKFTDYESLIFNRHSFAV